MAEIRPAEASMTEQIVELLRGYDEGRTPPELWRNFLAFPWRRPEDPLGYVLWGEGTAQGFIGTVFSRFPVGAREHRFCNITGWIVTPKYRIQGGFLLKEVLKLPGVTFTALSPREALVSGLRTLGFQPLETHTQNLWAGRGGLFRDRGVRISEAPEDLNAWLTEPERQAVRDHAPYPCHHLVIRRGEESCYVVYNRKRARHYPYAFVHHVGNPRLFSETAGQLALWLALHRGLPRLHWEKRFLRGHPVPGAREVASGYRLFLSETLAPEDVPNLYTEVVMLGT